MRTTCISKRLVDALLYMLEGDEVKTVDGWCDTKHEAVVPEPQRGLGVLCDSSFQRLVRSHDPHPASVSPPLSTSPHCRLTPAVWHHLGTPDKPTANHCTASSVSTPYCHFEVCLWIQSCFVTVYKTSDFQESSLTALINVIMRNLGVK